MSNDISERFGKRLRTLRKERKWTQQDLADKSGVGVTHVCELESGKREPCLHVIECLAACFKMAVSKFLEGV